MQRPRIKVRMHTAVGRLTFGNREREGGSKGTDEKAKQRERERQGAMGGIGRPGQKETETYGNRHRGRVSCAETNAKRNRNCPERRGLWSTAPGFS